MPRLDTYQLHTMPEGNIERPIFNPNPIQHNDIQTQDIDSTQKMQRISSKEDQFNESILTLLS